MAAVYLIFATIGIAVMQLRGKAFESAGESVCKSSNVITTFPSPARPIASHGYNNEPILPAPAPHIDEGTFLRPPARTNFLFIGLDNNLLADAIMVGTFYRDSGDIKLMSIPRDMYTYISPNRLEQMRADGLRPPTSLKINAVRAFGGRAHGIKYLQAQLGEMLGVHFHYYVEVEMDAFKRIVDAIGGVTMHIPQRLQYSDPCQNLFIDIPQGYQHLNGAMAEGVVRYRSFLTGDLMRNNIQMEFMSQLIKQVITKEAILSDPLALASVIINDVRTNASIVEMAKYLPYIGRISADRVTTFTLPGEAAFIDGISWFIPDPEALPGVVNRIFYFEDS